jgi:hypothetical protein
MKIIESRLRKLEDQLGTGRRQAADSTRSVQSRLGGRLSIWIRAFRSVMNADTCPLVPSAW